MALFLMPSTLAKLDQPGTQRHTLTIRELDGPNRSITLRGKSLPDEGFSAGVEQRGEVAYYPGNPVGSVQSMGPKFLPSTLTGRWDDYHLHEDSSYARLVNFPAVGPAGQPGSLSSGGPSFVSGGAVPAGEARSCRTLRDAFFKIAKSGLLVKVQWASLARYGILRRFEPTHLGEDSYTWEAEFDWIGDSDVAPKPRLGATDRLSIIQRILDAMRGALAAVNTGLALAFGSIAAALNPLQRLTTLVEDFLVTAGTAVDLAFTPQDVLGQLKQDLTRIKLAAGDLKAQVRSRVAGYEAELEGRGPAGVALSEDAVRDAVRQLLAMAAAADQGVADVEALEVPEVLGFYLTTGQETLRDIAIQFGYDADTGWQVIRDYNGLTNSLVPAGLRLLIPRKVAQ